jgi:translocation protein SEC63
LPDEQVTETLEVAGKYPQLILLNHEFAVLGEPAIIPSAIVTLSVKLATYCGEEPAAELLDDTIPPQEDEKKTWWAKADAGLPAYAPFYPSRKTPVWWVGIANASVNRLITINKTTSLEEPKTVRLQFQAPPQSGTWTFQLVIKSDSYLGVDQYVDVPLTVLPDSHAPLIEEEDDISEPDELIGMPVVAKKKGRGEFDDSDDSDDPGEDDTPERGDFVE